MKRYPAYKPSGVQWLGEIPEHWELIPHKRILELKKNVVGNESKNYTLLSLTLGGVIPRDLDNPQGKFPAEFDTYQIVEQGDLIFCLFDMDETPRTVGLSSHTGMITGAYTVFSPTAVEGKYLYYLYLYVDEKKAFKPLYTGLRKTLQKETFLSLKTALPSKDEQLAIVSYLDRKNAEIDGFVASKRKLIALLNEERTAFIQKVVLRGLNPDAPMKQTGVDWLGEVPAHWEVRRTKYLFKEIDNRTETGKEGLLSLRLYRGLIPDPNDAENLINKADLIGYKIIRPNQMVLNRMQASNGLFAVSKCLGLVSPDYAVFDIVDDIAPDYFIRQFRTTGMRAEFRKESRGLGDGSSGFLRLYSDRFGRIVCAVPPLIEQQAIVAEIEEQSKRIDAAISRIEREIELINEYRTALISEVVTGKIDVRETS